MFGDIKKKLAATRAQGALAVADMALGQGEAERAMQLYRKQARDLRARGGEGELEVRAWLGTLRAAEELIGGGYGIDQSVEEAAGAVASLSVTDLPVQWRRYSAWRSLAAALLGAGLPAAERLTRAMAGWFKQKPAAHYALARALEIEIRRPGVGETRRELIDEAQAAYRSALAAAAEAGDLERWEVTVKLRMAGLLWRYARQQTPEAAGEARRLLEEIDREALDDIPSAYQLIVAQIRLGSGTSMLRLRALDALAELADDPAFARAVLRILIEYLEALGWDYYPTEQDRIRAILPKLRGRLGESAVRRVLSHLDMLRELRGAGGRHSEASAEHLELLFRQELETRGESPASDYYRAALALSREEEGWRERLEDALERSEHLPDLRGLEVARRPMALALGALDLRLNPDRRRTRALLQGFGRSGYDVPHVQAGVALLLPTLAERWEAWFDLQPTMREAIGRYLQTAPPPSFGFAAAGLAMLDLGEEELAILAARRALMDQASEDGGALRSLLDSLARRELDAGAPERAVEWLIWTEDAGE